MAQDSQAAKSKWGVGNFFQQAVAGVESRLDNILLDQDENPAPPAAKPEKNENASAPVSRSPSGCMQFMRGH